MGCHRSVLKCSVRGFSTSQTVSRKLSSTRYFNDKSYFKFEIDNQWGLSSCSGAKASREADMGREAVAKYESIQPS